MDRPRRPLYDLESGARDPFFGLFLAKPESTEGGRRGSVLKRPEGAPVNLG